MGIVITIIASAAFCLGYVAQNVLAVYWTSAELSPYGILLVNTVAFPVIFGGGLLGYAIATKKWNVLLPADQKEQCSLFKRGSQMQLLCFTGLLNAINGVFIIYGMLWPLR